MAEIKEVKKISLVQSSFNPIENMFSKFEKKRSMRMTGAQLWSLNVTPNWQTT